MEEAISQSLQVRRIVACCLALVAIAVVAAAQEKHEWGYKGVAGPDHWSEFGVTCGLGKSQSPIDIHNAEQKNLLPIEFAYHSSPLKVIDTGHSIQVNYAPGSTIVVNGKTYVLQEFHFHHQSENAINGQHSPMELHLVHKADDGSLAVVAVILNEGHGNATVATVWANLPQDKEKEYAPEHVDVEAIHLIPANHRYYTFSGSLTTPPCSEGVTWLVMATPMTLSKGQIAKFAALYPDNARPIQPLNGRQVLESK